MRIILLCGYEIHHGREERGAREDSFFFFRRDEYYGVRADDISFRILFYHFFFRRVHHLRICRFDAIILGGGKQCDGSWAEEGRRGEVIIKLNEKIYIHTKNKYVSDQTMGRHNFDCQNQYY